MYACGVMVTVVENGHGDASSNPDKAVKTSHSANVLRIGMNPTIFPLVMDNELGRLPL